MIKQKNIAIFEMILLISMTFAISFIIHEGDKNIIIKNDNSTPFIFTIIKDLFDIIPSVSATASSAVQTCVNSKQGKTCQEYSADTCASACDGSCIPAPRIQVSDCRPGTCYDGVRGTCQMGSPKVLCTGTGTRWFDDPNGNIAQCSKGCCVLGNNAGLTTSQECSARALAAGITKDFRSEVQTEIACINIGGASDQGACVFSDKNGENTCKFTSRSSCITLNGEFNKNYLCSNPALQTNCIKQFKVGGITGQDALYWFDSCGNKENIYNADKTASYNNGMVQPASESCSVSSGNNPLANQLTCGNCNYLLGTTWGKKTSTQKLADETIDYVCRDLSCIDSSGKKHQNGESWCDYQGSIGVDGTGVNARASDTAGSRQFRQTCIKGEIQSESCGDYRTGICVQSVATSGQNSFSSAACRANHATECLNYNVQNQTSLCAQNPDCFLKHVEVNSNLKYDVCAPKYPIGFDLTNRPESAQAICSMGSQSCTITKIKGGIFSKDQEYNTECGTAKFAEQMNNLCMSLGDCGAKSNYVGRVTENYQVSNSPRLSSIYTSVLSNYKNPVQNQAADPGSDAFGSASLGAPNANALGQVSPQGNDVASKMLMTSGATGVSLLALAYLSQSVTAIGTTAVGTFFSGAGFTIGSIPHVPQVVFSYGLHPTAAGLGGAFAGAAIGLAVTSLLIKITGIGAGLSSGETYGLLGAGATAAAVIGYNVATNAANTIAFSTSGGASWLTVAATGMAVAVVVIIIIDKLLGAGKKTETKVTFTCQPWQAPTGGADCGKCGADGKPCSRYACESLGQTCQLVNEGTSSAACINNNPNDVSAPVITPQNGILPNGYSYVNTGDNGFTLKSSSADGCLPSFTSIPFGVTTSELSQCSYSTNHTDPTASGFSSMTSLGGSLFTYNHTAIFSLPSLESLGASSFNPNARADLSLYVKCKDKNGNINGNDYEINFCIMPGNDVTPAIISRASPVNDYVPFGATSQNISIYTNEPAECSWSTNDMPYSQMNSIMNCSNNLDDQTNLGFSCGANVPITGTDNKFYIRCLDQPWLNVSDPVNAGKTRNANPSSFVFDLKQSQTGLNITYISPNAVTLTYNQSPASVNLEVHTSGGLNGNAICEGNFGGYWVRFFDTGGSVHKWTLSQFTTGDKALDIRCTDDVGNSDTKTARFTINIDDTPPGITRVYADENTGALTVVTDENSSCFYNRYSCKYDINNATRLNGNELVHTTGFDKNINYYLKCADQLGNSPGDCSIIVRQGLL